MQQCFKTGSKKVPRAITERFEDCTHVVGHRQICIHTLCQRFVAKILIQDAATVAGYLAGSGIWADGQWQDTRHGYGVQGRWRDMRRDSAGRNGG